MALQTATIFKDFKITANSTNTAVTFYKNGTKTISVKNDNFATAVQVLDSADTTDLFDYKYITFDNSAVFEITDCIKNGKYTTLFLQYLSNITFDTADSNFYVDGVSVKTLQQLGLDINQLFEILGNDTEIKNEDTLLYNFAETQDKFLYAIRLRFSQIPENLNYRFTGHMNSGRPDIEQVPPETVHLGGRIANTSTPSGAAFASTEFNQDDSAISALLFIPTRDRALSLVFENTGTVSIPVDMFFYTLKALISDLVVSAEITAVSAHSLSFIGKYNGNEITDQLNIDVTPTNINIHIAEELTDTVSIAIRAIDTYLQNSHPVFLLTTFPFYGILENLNFIKIPLSLADNKIYTNFVFLGNTIDISKIKNPYIYIKRGVKTMRIYTDFERNIFTDIQTEFEFTKDAFSNYGAYQKSNIDLINMQNLETQKQMQKQQRKMQDMEQITTLSNMLTSTAQSAAVGMIAGPVGAAVAVAGNVIGTATNMISNEVKFNAQQHNDRANLELAAAQAHERANSIITPAQEMQGVLSVVSAFLTDTSGKRLLNYRFKYVEILNNQTSKRHAIMRYIFDNNIFTKIDNISQIKKPAWQNYFNFYKARINNRKAINNRKDLIIYIED